METCVFFMSNDGALGQMFSCENGMEEQNAARTIAESHNDKLNSDELNRFMENGVVTIREGTIYLGVLE